MAPIVTVHRGELLQIKRMIEKGEGKRGLRGDIYGLRTESRQPVIQFVCGQNDTKLTNMLQNGHGLRKLGEWVVQSSEESISREGVILAFSEKGDLTAYDFGKEATDVDILKGQSAFRLHKPLTNNAPDLAPIPTEVYDKENEHKEAQVTKEQWYSKPHGVKLLQEIYQSFPQAGLTVLNMSRDKATEDISLSLTVHNTKIILYCPPYFPRENPKVRLDDENEWSEVGREYEEGMPTEECAELLANFLLNFVNKRNAKKQLRNQSNVKQSKQATKQGSKKAKKAQYQGGQSKKDIPPTGHEQPPPMDEHGQPQRDEPPTRQELQLTGEHDQLQDEPQEPPPLNGERKQQQDEPTTGQDKLELTGEHDQLQDEPTAGKEPPLHCDNEQQRVEPTTGQDKLELTGEHDQLQDGPTAGKEPPVTGERKQQQDEPTTEQDPLLPGDNEQQQVESTTGKDKLKLTGEHDQLQNEPTAGKEPPVTGDNEQQQVEPTTEQDPLLPGDNEQQRVESTTGQDKLKLTGEHDQPQNEPTAGKEPPLTGDNEQQQDEPTTEQDPLLPGDNEQQRVESTTGQDKLKLTGQHDHLQDGPTTGQEQASMPRKTDKVSEESPGEKMDIEITIENQQKGSEENMEIDDDQNVSTKF